MTYKEQIAKATKEGKLVDMTYRSFSFDKEGDSVQGELIDIQDVHFEKTNSNVKKYIMKTDDDTVSVICGAIGDSQLDGRVFPGDLIIFTFVEKKTLSGGRTANIFNIQSSPGANHNGTETNDTPATN